MKRYLLLASVAGCLLASNAMADDPITADGQSATINIDATLQEAALITGVTDINLGTIVETRAYHQSGKNQNVVVVFDPDHPDEPLFCNAIACKGTTSRGSVTISGTAAQLLLNGTDKTTGNINLSDHLYVQVLHSETSSITDKTVILSPRLFRTKGVALTDNDFGSKHATVTVQLAY